MMPTKIIEQTTKKLNCNDQNLLEIIVVTQFLKWSKLESSITSANYILSRRKSNLTESSTYRAML